jgi:hypothetical protein
MKYQQVAMMTRLRVELPQMSKQDDAATHAAEAAFGASGAGRYRKDLYPKHLVDPIHAAVAAARAYMYSQTRPLGHGEVYLLPNRRIMTYLDMMGKHELAFRQTVTAFLNNWANVLMQAQAQQGGLFNSGEYPDVSSLAGQFLFEYPLTPIGNVRDIVLDELDEAATAAIVAKAQADERTSNEMVVKAAVADLRTEVLRIIKQTTVTATTDKKGNPVERTGKIYDTLTSDIAELIGVLQDLGAGGDPMLQDILAQADMHLTIPADALRADLEVCRITKDRAEQILKSMEAFA